MNPATQPAPQTQRFDLGEYFESITCAYEAERGSLDACLAVGDRDASRVVARRARELRREVTSNASGVGVIQHGQASIGKQIEQQVGAEVPIPENITFEVPIWDAHFRKIEPIDCAIEIDSANQTFSIIPLPQSIEDAVANAESVLGEALISLLRPGEGAPAAVPVYYGSP